MRSPVEERPRADALADILKALAHHARLRIVAALCSTEESVMGLSERLDIPQAIVSQQLRILRMMGLVRTHREDGLAVYELAEPHLHDLMACLDRCCKEAQGRAARRTRSRG